LKEKIKNKDGKIKDLKWKLKMNSLNSSIPSSKEWLNKKTKVCNSRKKSNKARWWQKWHTWKNLGRNENVDEIIDVTPQECSDCWFRLLNNFSNYVTRQIRQVIDMITPSMKINDYKWYVVKCDNCWFINYPIFPEWVTKPVQYWQEIKAFSSYLYNYQFLSYDRLQEFYSDIVWLKISQTSLCNFNKIWYKNLENFEDKLKQVLVKQHLLHADETWARVAWKLGRIHVNSNERYTYLMYHKKRWREAIEDMWILNNFLWNCITDHWKSYIIYSFIHYLCNAHHLRELTWVIENEKKIWAKEIINLLIQAKRQKEKLISKWIFSLEKENLEKIHNQYKDILTKWKLEYTENTKRKKWQRWRLKKNKWLNLLERLEEYEGWTLWFIDDFSIPFDNNLAERDLRMVKTRIKISGCFRSEEWTEWFCRIRSYISTLRKQNVRVYSALQSIYSWKITLPEF
jgi:transposase